jgi:hypothetical protein
VIKIDSKKGEFILSGEKKVLLAEIYVAIGAVVEGCREKEDKVEVVAIIYDLVTNPASPLWEDTGVTVGAIKRHIANKERVQSRFNEFIGRRFGGEI